MNFIPAECPNCGGKLQVPDDVEKVSCMYCKADILLQTDDTNANRVKSLLKFIEAEISVDNLEEVYSQCNKILEIEPENSEAWLYKGHCELMMSKDEDSIQKTIGYYRYAFDFSKDKGRTFHTIFAKVERYCRDKMTQFQDPYACKCSAFLSEARGDSEIRYLLSTLSDMEELFFPAVCDFEGGMSLCDALSEMLSTVDVFSENEIAAKQIVACPQCLQKYEIDSPESAQPVVCESCQREFIVTPGGQNSGKTPALFNEQLDALKIKMAKFILRMGQSNLHGFQFVCAKTPDAENRYHTMRRKYYPYLMRAQKVLDGYGVHDDKGSYLKGLKIPSFRKSVPQWLIVVLCVLTLIICYFAVKALS